MNSKYSNPCTRCGKERIIGKSWVENVGNSKITNSLTVCPDHDCQKKVEKENKKREASHAARILDFEKRASSRRSLKRKVN